VSETGHFLADLRQSMRKKFMNPYEYWACSLLRNDECSLVYIYRKSVATFSWNRCLDMQDAAGEYEVEGEVTGTSEVRIPVCHVTRRHIPENRYLRLIHLIRSALTVTWCRVLVLKLIGFHLVKKSYSFRRQIFTSV
jgi:hypothetical protein